MKTITNICIGSLFLFAVVFTGYAQSASFEEGTAYLEIGKFNKAIKAFTKAIAADPQNAEIYNSRAMAYLNKGDGEKALEDYNKAIALDSRNPDAYTGRALIHFDTGNEKQALADLNKSIEIEPTADAHAYRGMLHIGNLDEEKALADLNKAIELDFEGPDALLARATLYVENEDYAAAAQDYEALLELGIELGAPKSFLRDIQDLLDIAEAMQ